MTIEGITYHRYRVRFRLSSGRRVCWVRWAPYPGALFESLQRELEERFTAQELPPRSTIHLEAA